MFRTKPSALLLAAVLAFAGCSAGTGFDTEVCSSDLPGDIDCAPSDDKADAWDSRNDPERVSRSLNYRLDELPMEGQSEQEVWAASYWPTAEGSTNYRWQGENTLSPLEKFDMAMHDWTPDERFAESVPEDCGPDAHEKYTEYRDTLGPAAKWQAGAQNRTRMFDGIDNDDDEEIDECGSDTDGVESWWGLCHAWAPAAILEPEPLHAVDFNGQRFEVSDIKALILTAYDGTNSLFLGGRCNAKEFEHDENDRIEQDECRDVNAGAWHVVVANFIGVNKQAFVEDRTGGSEVWNQPLTGYNITMQEEIDLARANELLSIEGDEYVFNDRAERFFEVKMTTDYLTEGSQDTEPLGSDGYIRHDSYHYLLELNADGKIIGGEWLGRSRENHPDFLWVPTGARTSAGRRSNPHVELDTVRTILELSRAEENPEQPAEGETISSEEEVAIPDDDAEGISSTLRVSDEFSTETITVSVNIEHTYRGDLRVALSHDGVEVVLHDEEGGSADDIHETYRVTDFSATGSQGEWTLKVSDHAGEDVGSLKGFSLTFISGS